MLIGWKAIAAFLESLGGPASERMARHLGGDGLPAYQTSAGGRVQAAEDEVRRWWTARKKLVGSKRAGEWSKMTPRGRKRAA